MDLKPAARSSHFLKNKWEMERKQVNRKTEFVMMHLRRGNCFEAEKKKLMFRMQVGLQTVNFRSFKNSAKNKKNQMSLYGDQVQIVQLCRILVVVEAPLGSGRVEAQASQLTASIQK